MLRPIGLGLGFRVRVRVRVRWGGQRLVGTLWSQVLLAYCAVCECEG